MKKLFVLITITLICFPVLGQKQDSIWNAYVSGMDNEYDAYVRKLDKEYVSHLDKLNVEYENYMRKSWEEYTAITGIPRPKEDMPPIIFDKENQEHRSIKEIPIKVIQVPTPHPQPQPIAPIKGDNMQGSKIEVLFFNTPIAVRKPNNLSFTISESSNKGFADAWARMSNGDFNNLILDCVEVRNLYSLSDWAYLSFLQLLSEKLFGKSNEAVFLQAYIYALSGYSMRLAFGETGKLYMLIESEYILFDMLYFEVGDKTFYPLNCDEESLFICDAMIPDEKAMTLQIYQEQKLKYDTYDHLNTISNNEVNVQCAINKNMIDFFNTYPSGQLGEDFGTLWAMYANTPIDKRIRESLYPQLKKYIYGKNEEESANLILNWMQTAFEYQYDDSIWGYDRAFFPIETLYYPYCDCEDKSILFSRIVRDVMGLDVVLLYVPGHLATAVKFNSDIEGDFVIIDEEKYIICDPTCVGAPVGMSCTDDEDAEVIKLIRGNIE